MTSTRTRISALLAAGLISVTLMGGCKSIGKRNTNKPSKSARVEAAPNMGVNSFLWRASLETLEFMPTASVDPFGGVITKDWFASPEAPDERFKIDVYILDANLRADALKASVFKQVRNGTGWSDAAVDADTGRQIENAILTRARELYIATVDSR